MCDAVTSLAGVNICLVLEKKTRGGIFLENKLKTMLQYPALAFIILKFQKV